MELKEKVIKGLECCAYSKNGDKCEQCPYFSGCETEYGAFVELAHDALKLLVSQDEMYTNFVISWLREIYLNNIDWDEQISFLNAIEDIRDRAFYGLKQYFHDKQDGGEAK